MPTSSNTLRITQAGLNVTANSQGKLVGTNDPLLTFNVTGLVNNPALGIDDTAGTVLSGAIMRILGETVLGNPYTILQNSLVANSNYIISFMNNYLIITGTAAAPIPGAVAPIINSNAGQVVFAGVMNNNSYSHHDNFWHISLNYDNADPGFDVMRGTSDSESTLNGSLNGCDGDFCETWSFPQQFEKVLRK